MGIPHDLLTYLIRIDTRFCTKKSGGVTGKTFLGHFGGLGILFVEATAQDERQDGEVDESTAATNVVVTRCSTALQVFEGIEMACTAAEIAGYMAGLLFVLQFLGNHFPRQCSCS